MVDAALVAAIVAAFVAAIAVVVVAWRFALAFERWSKLDALSRRKPALV